MNPVDKCSLSEQDWNMKSNQLRCNKTHGYHCVPNKNLTSLIEFCYPGGRFEKGNEWMCQSMDIFEYLIRYLSVYQIKDIYYKVLENRQTYV